MSYHGIIYPPRAPPAASPPGPPASPPAGPFPGRVALTCLALLVVIVIVMLIQLLIVISVSNNNGRVALTCLALLAVRRMYPFMLGRCVPFVSHLVVMSLASSSDFGIAPFAWRYSSSAICLNSASLVSYVFRRVKDHQTLLPHSLFITLKENLR